MAVIPIRTLGDPVLREPGRDVEVFDAALRSLIGDMFETMYAAPGVGLAAPQIGLAIRLFVFDAGDEEGEQRGVVANPVLSRMKGELLEDEGCLSIPGVYRPTPRALTVRVDGLDADGRPITLVGEDLLARIFLHETDHTNGRLYIDHLSDEGRRQVMAELRDRELGGARPGSALRD